jgi:hypothetical protein
MKKNKVDKDHYFYSMLGRPETTTIHSNVGRLTVRIASCAEKDEPIPLFYAYPCLACDVISDYAFGKQQGLLGRADWEESFYYSWSPLWEKMALIRQIPNLFKYMQRICHGFCRE